MTPLAATLLSDSPDSVLPGALLAHAPFHWNSWSHLHHSVMTGQCAFEHVYGTELFDYLRTDRAAAQVYEGWMTRLSDMQAPALINSYDYAKFPTVVDVGGGHGALLVAILKAYPGVCGVLFDLPEILADARLVREAGLESRCSVVSGDMFERVYPGGDLYILKTVIHDWDNDSSIRIFKNCREAMTTESRLLLMEMVVPEGNDPHPSKFMDLNMLVLTHGGRERTAAEYRALFEASGFELSRIIATPSPVSLLEGIPQ
ncbi:MAG: methyltransferase [Rhodospirillales bacterium]